MNRIFILTSLILVFTMCATSQETTSNNNTIFKVGDIGPSGGFVFYDKGEYTDGWRYLEAAPHEYEFSSNWSNAPNICNLLNINGFTGWRMPTKDELNFMYLNLKQKDIGDFGNHMYWSSSADNTFLSFTAYISFNNGIILFADRGGRNIVSYRVRAVREF